MLKAFLLIVVGLAGDPESAKEIGKTFNKWGNDLAAASEKLGVPQDRLVYLADQTQEGDARVSGKATRDDVIKALDGFAKKATPEDVVFIVFIGHGSDDGRTAKFNLTGPDIAAPEIDKQLRKLPTKQVVLVNTTSASGPFIEALSAPGRTIVTATRSGAEHFTTLFGGYFVEALTSNATAADADKNKRVSVLEAFQYAKTEVARAYEREGLLATEHALLDDDGDKEGSPTPSATGKDGKVAAVLSLGVIGGDDLPADPKVRALTLERRDMERRVEALRLLKDSMEPAKYTSELEKLVTAIALKTREIRAAEAAATGAQGR
jgi:peptidase C13-like protein